VHTIDCVTRILPARSLQYKLSRNLEEEEEEEEEEEDDDDDDDDCRYSRAPIFK